MGGLDDIELLRTLDKDTYLPLWRDLAPRGRSPAASKPVPSAPAAASSLPTRAAAPAAATTPTPVVPSPTVSARVTPPTPLPVLDGGGPKPALKVSDPHGRVPDQGGFSPLWAGLSDEEMSQSDADADRGSAAKAAWRAAVAESQEVLGKRPPRDVPEDLSPGELVDLEAGDVLVHPRLGECEVVRVEDDVAAYIRLPGSRRISKLALTVVRLVRVPERTDARVFKVLTGSGE